MAPILPAYWMLYRPIGKTQKFLIFLLKARHYIGARDDSAPLALVPAHISLFPPVQSGTLGESQMTFNWNVEGAKLYTKKQVNPGEQAQ